VSTAKEDKLLPGSLRGVLRARSHCHFAPLLIHFTPELLKYSVPLFLKRKCGRTLGALFAAARDGDSAAVARLLAAGADPNALVAGRSPSGEVALGRGRIVVLYGRSSTVFQMR
jgi:hypothetical protein